MALIADLAREARRDDLPVTVRRLAALGHQKMSELLVAVRAGNELLIEEIVRGTTKEDGRRRPDGLAQIIPYWARGPAVLRELVGVVVVDEDQQPVTVTVHWERVPPSRRREAASLASELVDAYYGRPKGGRPRGSRKESAAKPGHPDTGAGSG